MKKKYFFKALVEKANEDGTLSVAVATDGGVDRDFERIDPEGWDFSNFLKNPVLLWAHDYRQTPLGKVEQLRKDGKRVLFTPRFAIEISERAKEVFELFKAGFLNAFSVGFIPREWKDTQDPENGRTIRTFTKVELLEISAVPVPANPRAVVLARGLNVGEDLIKQMEEADDDVIDPPETDETDEEKNQKRLEELEKELATEKEKNATLTADNATLKAENETLKNPSVGKSAGAPVDEDGPKVDRKGNASRDILDELDEGLFVKRVLQTVDKEIGEALRKLKQRRLSS